MDNVSALVRVLISRILHNSQNFWIKQSSIMVIIISDLLMFDQLFLSPQVQQQMIVSNKHGIYELNLELPHNIRPRDLRKLGNIRKISKLYGILA